ncbi:TlyA family RNA methyltransferase [Thermodesulfobacteriota bacterium]
MDLLLVEKGLAESREKAKAIIMAGEVEVNGSRIDKPGHTVDALSEISVKSPYPPYVSRGGLKLEAVLDHFSIDVTGKTLLDIGASTGGFTDCLLQRGADRIIAVDVGYGQFHWKLRQDPRVILLEKTNARNLTQDQINETVNGAVIDVSFISLALILPPITAILQDGSFVAALIKPQFEVGRHQVGKGGVVRDPKLHNDVIKKITGICESLGYRISGTIPSPVIGPKGNREFLIYAEK